MEDLFIIKRDGKYLLRVTTGISTLYRWTDNKKQATRLNEYQAKQVNKLVLGTIIKELPRGKGEEI